MPASPLRVALTRHPVSSIAATAVDFAVMISLVSLLGFPASVGTGIGVVAGAGLNFLVGRWWVFRASRGPVGAQAGRYVFVSAGGLLLNSVGVHLLAESHHVPYVLARIVVSIVVSFGWSFLLQRLFVFGANDP